MRVATTWMATLLTLAGCGGPPSGGPPSGGPRSNPEATAASPVAETPRHETAQDGSHEQTGWHEQAGTRAEPTTAARPESDAGTVLDVAADAAVGHAADQDAPDPSCNLLLVSWPFGLQPGWTPAGVGANYQLTDRGPGGGPYGTESQLTTLVAAHRDRLLIASGMQGLVTELILIHPHGPTTMWTGWARTDADYRLPSPFDSVDQVIANAIGARSPFRSLHAGPLVDTREFREPSMNALPYYHFRDGAGLPGASDPDLFVKGLRARLAATTQNRGDAGTGSECKFDVDAKLAREGSRDTANGRALTETFASVLAEAFRCGLTRVATLQLGEPDCGYTVPYEGATSSVNRASHSQGVSTTADRLTRWVSARYMLDRASDILTALEQVGVLEDTLVVMSSDQAGYDNDANIPVFIAEGANCRGAFHFRRGEHVALPGTNRISRLLVTLTQYFGLPGDTVGNYRGPGEYSGALDALKLP